YFVRFELLDANQQMIAFWENGTQAAPLVLAANTAFFQVAHTFRNYGPSLRFLRFIDGGRDLNAWSGNYGTHFDDAYAGITPVGACCMPGGNCALVAQSQCARQWSGAWSDCSSVFCGGASLGDMNCDGTFN